MLMHIFLLICVTGTKERESLTMFYNTAGKCCGNNHKAIHCVYNKECKIMGSFGTVVISLDLFFNIYIGNLVLSASSYI